MDRERLRRKGKKRHTFFISALILGIAGMLSIMLLLMQPTISGVTTSPTTISTPTPILEPTPTPEPSPTPTPMPTPVPTPMPTIELKPMPDMVAYLTFDDGPSELTLEVDKILTRYDIKATFFVLNRTDDRSKQIIKHTSELGHTIGMHGASHNYDTIYKSADAFNLNLDLNYHFIADATGIRPTLIRFPGGSVNDYNAPFRREIIEAVSDRGYVYFDWNCSSGDGNPALQAPDVILKNVLRTAGSQKRIVVLMHDSSSKTTTVEALPSIIESLRKKGYSFDRLTNEVAPVHFTMK